MTRFAFFIGVCLSFTATFARADADKLVAEKTRALHGTWEVRDAEISGPDRVEKLPAGALWTFGKDGTYKVELMGTVIREGTWKVVAVKDKVVHLDMTVKRTQQTVLSILEFVNADTVRLCSTAPNAETRPTKFEVTKGSRLRLFSLKRVKE